MFHFILIVLSSFVFLNSSLGDHAHKVKPLSRDHIFNSKINCLATTKTANNQLVILNIDIITHPYRGPNTLALESVYPTGVKEEFSLGTSSGTWSTNNKNDSDGDVLYSYDKGFSAMSEQMAFGEKAPNLLAHDPELSDLNEWKIQINKREGKLEHYPAQFELSKAVIGGAVSEKINIKGRCYFRIIL